MLAPVDWTILQKMVMGTTVAQIKVKEKENDTGGKQVSSSKILKGIALCLASG